MDRYKECRQGSGSNRTNVDISVDCAGGLGSRSEEGSSTLEARSQRRKLFLAFSGSNNPDAVAWYGPRWGHLDQALVRLLGWRAVWRLANRTRKLIPRCTRTHRVATKAPNQM